MRLLSFLPLPLLTALLPFLPPAFATSASASTPQPPSLTFLYTALVTCHNPLYTTNGPIGLRTAIPIVGGNVTGPRINGRIRDLGADWGWTDVQTGIFSADTRYNVLTDDGANIFLRTSGPAQKNGDLHLRVVFETGDKQYYWLNNVVAIGVLQQVEQDEHTFLLRIDVWHMTSDWTTTTFTNGSTYP